MTRSNIFILSCIVFISVAFTSVDVRFATIEFANISRAYKNLTRMNLDVKYQVFLGYQSPVLESSLDGFFKRNDTLMVSKMHDILTYGSKKCNISVNQYDKEIYISDPNPNELLAGQFKQIENNLNKASKIQYADSSQTGLKIISLSFEKSPWQEVEKIDIYYSKDYLLRKIVMYVPDAGYMSDEYDGRAVRVVIDYTIKPFGFDYKPEIFKLENYMEKTPKGFVGKGKFSTYKIMDLRTRKL